MSSRPTVLLAMEPALLPGLLDAQALARLNHLADVVPGLILHGPAGPSDAGAPGRSAALAGAEVLFASWGCPPLDEELLAAAPRLQALVYAAGSVKGIVTESSRRRGVQVSTAAWANALPVAEYTVAAVLFANKQILAVREEFRRVRGTHDWRGQLGHIGNYRRTIGIVGASRIGRRVIELLHPYDLDLVVHDPFLAPAEAADLGVRGVELDELCAVSDVVSLHAPHLPATEGMIDARRLALMRDGATLINTARGALVDTPALSAELVSGRLNAVIDTIDPDLLPADSPLYDLPNLLLTPHIAGSFGNETRRLGDAALDELARYAAGLPFAHPLADDRLDRIA
ncbi:hydroxyacid dehydrogenase [Streptacidiphilus sp. EB103A]|uniref:hydroxyacid dehydrogenase n=1 Tax=Streptacidiphilus sp. EB103A TaxID=3156275 RepID=UPI003512B422